MIVRPWEDGDLRNLMLQPSQQFMSAMLDDLRIAPLAEKGLAWTGVDEDKVIGVAGLHPIWDNRALAWAIISRDAGAHFVQIHKQTLSFLNNSPFRRIEATVDVGFDQGHRWIKMLGFELEGYLRAYRPDGEDQILYSRIR
jgi:RimJ/RimL family protein N-acetyltransferase